MTTLITPPTLAEGERYIGAIVTAQGEITQIILLPGDAKANWKDAITWANSIGGDLPNRVEQSLLYATAPEEFKQDWYWSNQPHAEAGFAWHQIFDYGYQVSGHTSYELRARAVRRLIIQ